MTTKTWNVYKIFANGKRAKFPVQSFEYDDETLAHEYFINNIKTTFTAKQQKANYTMVRNDLPQDRIENIHSTEEILQKKRAKIIKIYMKDSEVEPLVEPNLQFGMLLSEKTDFKWQWCAMEGGTTRYLRGISPKFARHADAIDWVDSKFDE